MTNNGNDENHQQKRWLLGVPLLKLRLRTNKHGHPLEVQGINPEDTQTVLYELHADPEQSKPINSPETERELVNAMNTLMQRADAPDELSTRFSLVSPGDVKPGNANPGNIQKGRLDA